MIVTNVFGDKNLSYLSVGLLAAVLCLFALSRALFGVRIAPGRLPSRFGGVAMILAILVTGGLATFVQIGTSGAPATRLLPILAGMALVFFVGRIDDLRPLNPWAKLVGQIGAASAAWSLGLNAGFLPDGPLDCAFTVFCLVGGANAFNLIDGLDGLAGGVGVIAGATIFFMARNAGHVDAAVLAAALTGAAVGFAWFNLPPARVFMGDSGSNLLGFGLAATPLLLSHGPAGFGEFSAGIAVLAVPIAETATTIARRLMRGGSPLRGDLNHIHHRLLRQGMPVGGVLAVFYVTTLAISAVVLFGNDLAQAPFDKALRSWSAVGVMLVASSVFVYFHARLVKSSTSPGAS